MKNVFDKRIVVKPIVLIDTSANFEVNNVGRQRQSQCLFKRQSLSMTNKDTQKMLNCFFSEVL